MIMSGSYAKDLKGGKAPCAPNPKPKKKKKGDGYATQDCSMCRPANKRNKP